MSEIRKFLKEKNISYEQMVELCSNNSSIIDSKEFYVVDYSFYFMINSNSSDEYAILFKNKFKLKLIRTEDENFEKNIICHLEIIDLIDDLKIQDKYIFFDEYGKKIFKSTFLILIHLLKMEN